MINYDALISAFLLYLPVSFIGSWRWSLWGVRRVVSLLYQPLRTNWPASQPKPTSTIVVPVYNEDPKVFALALESWIKNGVDEIVAVIDYTDTRNIYHFSQAQKHTKTKLKLIVTRKAGKRPNLVEGILASKGDIIALVDSDTIWSPQVLERSLPYFLDQKIGGVTVRQRVYEPRTISQILFDILLYVRYTEELPFMAATGYIVNTMSGRTAIYRRTALLNAKHDNMHLLTHEYFLNSRCVSGDDKRLTHLIAEQGWFIAYQGLASVYTPGTPDLRTFLKQRLRWIRNSWRADTRAFQRGWIFDHPALALMNFDRFIQPFFMLFGLSIFILSIWHQEWILTGSILVWWVLTRFIRLLGYFVHYPARTVFLPVYLVFSYWTAIIKIYAWFTIVEQGWITRWHANRLKAAKRLGNLQGTVLTTATLFLILGLAISWKWYLTLRYEESIVEAQAMPYYSDHRLAVSAAPSSEPPLPTDAKTVESLNVYVVKQNENLTSIARQIGVPIRDLQRANVITNKHLLTVGQEIYYP